MRLNAYLVKPPTHPISTLHTAQLEISGLEQYQQHKSSLDKPYAVNI